MNEQKCEEGEREGEEGAGDHRGQKGSQGQREEPEAGRGVTCEEPQKDPHGWADEDRGEITAIPGLESKAPGSSVPAINDKEEKKQTELKCGPCQCTG